jgi:enoyl-CoA hydratase
MVQGYCIMGGLMLASACDIIIAAEDAKFTDRAVRQGAPHVQYLSLPWDIGVRKAKELIFTGDYMDAQSALQSGLVNRVVPLNRLEQETLELAKRIALQDIFAVRLAKASLNAAQDTMGFTNAINSAFKSHQLASVRRSMEGRRISKKPDESVAEWVARRDSEFGDHH